MSLSANVSHTLSKAPKHSGLSRPSDCLGFEFLPQFLSYDDQQHARLRFDDGELNICYAAIDYHVEQGRGDQPAILFGFSRYPIKASHYLSNVA